MKITHYDSPSLSDNYVIIQPFDATHLVRVPMKFPKWEMSLVCNPMSKLQLTFFLVPKKSSYYSVWADIYRFLLLQKLISGRKMWFLFKFSICQETIRYASLFFCWWGFSSTRIQNLRCVITKILELYFIQCKNKHFFASIKSRKSLFCRKAISLTHVRT